MTEPVAGTVLFAEQVRHLYRLSRPAYIATLVNAGIVTVVLWNVVPNGLLLAWLAAMTAVIGARYALYRRVFQGAATAGRGARLGAALRSRRRRDGPALGGPRRRRSTRCRPCRTSSW